MTKTFCDICKEECGVWYIYTVHKPFNPFQAMTAEEIHRAHYGPEVFCKPCLIKHLSELK